MWVISVAAAQAPRCEPLDETAFRSYVLDAQSAVDRGDIELPSAILQELEERVPCLVFPPQPRMWADLLVTKAIVEYARGGPWEDALAAALRIRPAIDRGVGANHPMATWEPPPAPPGGPPIPSGVRLYVDGSISPTVPPSEGLYLVQKTDGRFWNTLLLQDTPVPEDWATSAVDQPPRIASWGRIGAVVGGGSVSQDNDWESDWYVDVTPERTRNLAIGLVGDVHVTFFSPFGVLGHGAVAWLPTSPGLDARVSAIWAWRGLTVGGGAGVVSIDTFEAVGDSEIDPRVLLLRYPQGTVLLRSLRGLRLDAGVTLGGTGPLVVLDTTVGWLVSNRVRMGLDVMARGARFTEEGFPTRELTTSSSRALLRLDWIRGEY